MRVSTTCGPPYEDHEQNNGSLQRRPSHLTKRKKILIGLAGVVVLAAIAATVSVLTLPNTQDPQGDTDESAETQAQVRGIRKIRPPICLRAGILFSGYYCKSGGECIKSSLECNGKSDCPDSSDEYCSQPCISNPCQNGTVCIEETLNSTVEGTLQHTCVDPVPCYSAEFLCASRLKCVAGEFECDGGIPDCPDGSDEHCDNPFCYPNNPCLNGGTCVKEGEYYHCFCPKDYGGRDCRHKKEELCASNPCQNGGWCMITSITYTNFTNGLVTERKELSHYYDCPRGLRGTNCEIEPKGCEFHNCPTNKTCKPAANNIGYTCEYNTYEYFSDSLFNKTLDDLGFFKVPTVSDFVWEDIPTFDFQPSSAHIP